MRPSLFCRCLLLLFSLFGRALITRTSACLHGLPHLPQTAPSPSRDAAFCRLLTLRGVVAGAACCRAGWRCYGVYVCSCLIRWYAGWFSGVYRRHRWR